jgi:hypothetical protein
MSIVSSLRSDAEPSSDYRKRKQYTHDQLGVPKTSLIEWIDLFPYLIAEKGGSYRFRLEGAGRLPETLEIEPELLKFIEEQRRLDIGLTTNEIIYKAMELDESLKGKPYSTLHTWCYKFLRRHSFSIRRITHVGQAIKDSSKTDYENFFKTLYNLRK